MDTDTILDRLVEVSIQLGDARCEVYKVKRENLNLQQRIAYLESLLPRDTYTIKLVGPIAAKINAIKAVRGAIGCDLRAGKDIVESPTMTVASGVTLVEANRITKSLLKDGFSSTTTKDPSIAQ